MDKRTYKDILVSVVAGYILNSISLLSFLVAFPILMLSRRYKCKEALISASLLFLLIVATSLFQVGGIELNSFQLCTFLLGLFIPFSLLAGAVIWVKTKGEGVLVRYAKALLPACVSFIGFVIWFSVDKTMLSQVVDSYNSIISSIWGDLLLELGIDAELFSKVVALVFHSVVLPLTASIIGVTSFVSSASIRVADPEFDCEVANFAVGEKAIWPFLVSWTMVLLSRFITYPTALSVIVVNVAMISTLIYIFVGYCILFYYHKKNKENAKAINLFFLIVGLIMLLPGMNIALVFILSILGILETWFTLRK